MKLGVPEQVTATAALKVPLAYPVQNSITDPDVVARRENVTPPPLIDETVALLTVIATQMALPALAQVSVPVVPETP